MIERFRKATSAQQILLVLLIGMVVALLLSVLWFQVLRVNYKPLFSQLQPADAATIITELEKRKIPYQLSQGGSTIMVPADQADAARINLVGNDLPIKGTVGFELFNKSDMGLTDFAQKINYQRALQGELTRTIMSLDGVDSARVHLSLGEDRVFRDDRVPPKASVTVHMENGRPISEREADGIRSIVAAAVPRLDDAQVTVVDEKGEVIGPGWSAQSTPALTPLMQEKYAIEQYYEARIRQAITARYPGETISVAVWADRTVTVSGETTKEIVAQDSTAPWAGGARDFRLQITLSPAGIRSQEVLVDLRQITGTAIGYDAALGDAITFGAAPPPTKAVSRAETGLRSAAVSYGKENPPVENESIGQWWSASSMGLLAIVGGIFMCLLVLKQRPSKPRLSPEQREAFATKFDSLLEEGGTHV